jgi:hypothetical protein
VAMQPIRPQQAASHVGIAAAHASLTPQVQVAHSSLISGAAFSHCRRR